MNINIGMLLMDPIDTILKDFDDVEAVENRSRWDTIIAALQRIVHVSLESTSDDEAPSEAVATFVEQYTKLKQQCGVKCPVGIILTPDGAFHLEWHNTDGSRLALEIEKIEDGIAYGESMRSFTIEGQRQHEFMPWQHNHSLRMLSLPHL